MCSGLSTREDRPRIRLLTRSPRAGLSRQIRSRAFCAFFAPSRAREKCFGKRNGMLSFVTISDRSPRERTEGNRWP